MKLSYVKSMMEGNALSHKILVIEDEPTLSRLLSYNLKQEGYDATVIENGSEGYQSAVRYEYDLIILDMMLPGMDGLEILTKLRQKDIKCPIIILTARTGEEEIVRALKQGADDYITKPFGVAELLARVSAVLRRTRSEEPGDDRQEKKSGAIQVGELSIYPDKYEVTLHEEVIPLRPKEFEVLLYLVQRPGVVVTRDDLMNAVWGFDYIGGQRTVDVHVSSLRKKLEMNQENVYIDSIRGVGYKLAVKNKVK
jgi:two-component system alkaline phosphatase synthesis response regulator PhoP